MFATTKALAFQRSAELARSFKNLFLRPEEFETFACVFCQTPSPFGLLVSVLRLQRVANDVQRHYFNVVQNISITFFNSQFANESET